MTEPLLHLAFAAAGAPLQINREMAQAAIEEIISLQSEAVRLREEVARLTGNLALAEKLCDAFSERYGALHERYRELSGVLEPVIERSEEKRLVQ